MREALGPYRAALTQGRRRSIILLLLIALGIFGAIAWSSFRPLEARRAFARQLEAGRLQPQDFLGMSCSGGEEFPGGPVEPGVEPGGSETPAERPIAPARGSLMCQFIGPNGEPIGPTFEEDPISGIKGQLPQSFLDELRPQLLDSARDQIESMEKALAPKALFENRVKAFGTFLGIVLIVVFASTLFGAEMRWGVWRTLLTHEPRRGRLLASKYAALWTYVLVGLALALALSTTIDHVMRIVLDVDATGGPSIGHLAEQTGWAALSLATYATIAGALTLSVRTSIAGIAALIILLGDHLLVQKFIWLRAYFPTQQIASLLPQPVTISSGYAWFPRIVQRFECVRTSAEPFPVCREIMLKPIPHWRASLVLGGWLIAFALAAWAVLRARDVPQ